MEKIFWGARWSSMKLVRNRKAAVEEAAAEVGAVAEAVGVAAATVEDAAEVMAAGTGAVATGRVD
jgi:hypothetical protein